ncbi:MAG: twin-arginine translocation signal domain-containing protein [Acidobacteriaceae bacterium]|nr:twin-arginine translocation signal domain-containing protein [Acidobacteriaceae bacterium]
MNFEISRRDFVKAAGAVPLAASLAGFGLAEETKALGEWGEDAAGLPRYAYLGPVPFPLPSARIPRRYLPEDPFFLLGNYRFTLFAHASGQYQILTGERCWGRLNQGPEWSGANRATVRVGAETVPLVGLTERAAQVAEKEFGLGYAQYSYRPAPDLRVTRTLSVLPSSKPGEGTSAFVLSVALRNEGVKPLDASYAESVKAAYQQLGMEGYTAQSPVRYTNSVVRQPREARCDVHAQEPRPLSFSKHGRMARFEGAPPSLFVRVVSADGVTATAEKDAEGSDWIGAHAAFTLAPAQEKVFHCIVGYACSPAEIDRIADVLTGALGKTIGPHFREAWKHAVPEFAGETDAELRREMRWNAGVLEQMAIWREYYGETVIPQGTIYDYAWGLLASSRDLAQQALPLCHTNPALARSTLRFIMKRTIPDGEIKLDDAGYGWAPHSGRLTSDQQLYFFLLLNEYLRATGDASILTEEVSYYPVERAGKGSGLDHVRDAFLFLRERIGTGPHGLVRLWNSDWNDLVFYLPISQPYNDIFDTAESHMNSAMAVVILGDLAETLRRYAKPDDARELEAAVTQYRAQLLKAYLDDWGSRPFPSRMYFENKAVGKDVMWLEPQGFTLLIPEVPRERKQLLYKELQERLIKGEAMGPKQIEKATDKPTLLAGQRENGGFWYSLTGPVVLGASTFDREAAMSLLRRLTFANYARQYPDYWTGQWSAADTLDASSLPTAGLVGLTMNIPYCAHPHAWPLYCYLRLKQARRSD